jgi:chaperonin GroES
MSDTFVAVGINIFIKREETESERNGLSLPDQAKARPNKGVILSVGKSVQDKGIKEGRKAVWNRHVGTDIDIDGETITVLREEEILGVS